MHIIGIIILIFFVSSRAFAIDKYDEIIKSVRHQTALGNFKEAEGILKKSLILYPDNIDLLEMLTNILSWQNNYKDALDIVNTLIKLDDKQQYEQIKQKIVINIKLAKAKNLIKKNEYVQAESLLKDLFYNSEAQYNSGYILGKLYMEERRYRQAFNLFSALHQIFPKDKDIILYIIDALILEHQYYAARQRLNSLKKEEYQYIVEVRPDIIYKLKDNYIKTSYNFFNYTKNYKPGREYSVELSQNIKNITMVLHSSTLDRYGLHDNQFGADFYSAMGESRWYSLSFSASPKANFLPSYICGGSIYQDDKNLEFSVGYKRMDFKDYPIDIINPGLTIYLSDYFSLGSFIYFIPNNGSYSLVVRNSYSPYYKVNTFLDFNIGNASEKIIQTNDRLKYETFGVNLGLQYRINQTFALSLSSSYEYRKSLYNEYGLYCSIAYYW